jgi:stearoyl-CoA desaturase (delta-9 desaturase)
MTINVGFSLTLLAMHVLAFIAIFTIKNINKYTVVLQIGMFILGMIGITAGYHRLWTHNTYEAKSGLEWFLMICGSISGQKDAIWWARNHRTHHRNEDKLSDPYSIEKGFWYAHIGWLLQNPDKLTQSEIDKTDVSDLESNKVLQFQQKSFIPLFLLVSFVIPTAVSSLWGDSYNCLWSCFIRNILLLHGTYCVNSFAHIGSDSNKPYNTSLQAAESPLVSAVTLGEGWHNYHHSYPKDFKASESDKFNPTTWFILLSHSLGLVTNMHEKCNLTEYMNDGTKFDKSYYCTR